MEFSFIIACKINNNVYVLVLNIFLFIKQIHNDLLISNSFSFVAFWSSDIISHTNHPTSPFAFPLTFISCYEHFVFIVIQAIRKKYNNKTNKLFLTHSLSNNPIYYYLRQIVTTIQQNILTSILSSPSLCASRYGISIMSSFWKKRAGLNIKNNNNHLIAAFATTTSSIHIVYINHHLFALPMFVRREKRERERERYNFNCGSNNKKIY